MSECDQASFGQNNDLNMHQQKCQTAQPINNIDIEGHPIISSNNIDIEVQSITPINNIDIEDQSIIPQNQQNLAIEGTLQHLQVAEQKIIKLDNDTYTVGLDNKKQICYKISGIGRIYCNTNGTVIDILENTSESQMNSVVHFNDKYLENCSINSKLQAQGKFVAEYKFIGGIKQINYKGGYKNGLRNGRGQKQLKYYSNQQMQQKNSIRSEKITGTWVNNIMEGKFLEIKHEMKKTQYLFCTKKDGLNVGKLWRLIQLKANPNVYYYNQEEFNEITKQLRIILTDVTEDAQQYRAYFQPLEKQTLDYWDKFKIPDLQSPCKSNNYYPISQMEIQQLTKITMLTNQACNIFGQYLFRQQHKIHPQFFIFSEKLLMSLIQNIYLDYKSQQNNPYNLTRSHTRLLCGSHNIFNKKWKKIMFPYSANRVHFCLYVLDLESFQLFHYNSLYGCNDKLNSFNSIKMFLKQYVRDKQRTKNVQSEQLLKKIEQLHYKQVQVPQQTDGISCGVYMCYFMHCLGYNHKISMDFQPFQYRKFIQSSIREIVQQKIDFIINHDEILSKYQISYVQATIIQI